MFQGDAWCHPDTEQTWGDVCVPQEVLGFPGEMLRCCSEMVEFCREVCWSSRQMFGSPGEMLGFLREASAYSREVFGCPGEILWCSKIVLVCPVDRLCNDQGRSLGAFGRCRGGLD